MTTQATATTTTIIPAEFNEDSTSSQVLNLFLHQLQQEPTNTFTIYPAVLCYPSLAHKQRLIASQTTEERKEEYKACHHIQAIKTKLKVDGTILWLSGSLFEIGMSGGDNAASWHAYIVIYCQRRLVVVDPDYQGEIGTSRRLKDLKGLGLFKQLVDFMGVARRAVEDIRVGHTGFGEPNSGARKRMCGEWVQDFVEKQCPMEWFDSWEVIRK